MSYDKFFELVAHYFESFGKDFTVVASSEALTVFVRLSSSFPKPPATYEQFATEAYYFAYNF